MSNGDGFVLTGAAEELQSPRAFKVLVTAIAASVSLTRKEVPSQEKLQPQTPSTTLSLVLTSPKLGFCLTTSNAMMRTIASFSPGSNLLGVSPVDQALVDGWMSFVWTSLDLPVQANLQSDVDRALGRVDLYLDSRTFLVGTSGTIADISLAVAIHTALERGLWSAEKTAHKSVLRFYRHLWNQTFIKEAFRVLSNVNSPVRTTIQQQISE